MSGENYEKIIRITYLKLAAQICYNFFHAVQKFQACNCPLVGYDEQFQLMGWGGHNGPTLAPEAF